MNLPEADEVEFVMIRFFLLIAMVIAPGTPFAADARSPLVIAHRGASGHLPEHTLEAYRLAAEMGADYIEPDLVATKDGVLIARHENEISGTTDVAAKFPTRKTAKTIDGRVMEGWFSEDFTLAEIKTLRAVERLTSRSHANDGKFEIPTFAEVIELANAEGQRRGRPVGIYPETKHSTYFARIGLPLEPALVKALTEAGLNRADAPVFVQSFEVSNLQRLRKSLRVPLIQLLSGPDEQPYDQEAAGTKLTYAAMISDQGLKDIAAYAQGIGPPKEFVFGPAAGDLVKRAHAAGLKVHPYTFRSDPPFLAADYKGDPAAEYCRFFTAGIDGLFSDFPDAAVAARNGGCVASLQGTPGSK